MTMPPDGPSKDWSDLQDQIAVTMRERVAKYSVPLPKGFIELRELIVCKAAADLERIAPEQVRQFKEEILGKRDRTAGCHPFDGPHETKFKKWSETGVAILDFELQLHRVNLVLDLLDLPAPPGHNDGEWVEYNISVWFLLMWGLLDRAEKMYKTMIRRLIRRPKEPCADIESQLLKDISFFKSLISEVRDGIAHSGGTVEAIGEARKIEELVLLGGQINPADALESMGEDKKHWHDSLTQHTNTMVEGIGDIAVFIREGVVRANTV